MLLSPKLPLASYKNLLTRYLKPQWHRVLLMTVLIFIYIGMQLVNPQILRYFIDTVIRGGNSTALALVGLIFVGVTLATQLISVLTTYLSENVTWTATNRLRTDLVSHCLTLDIAFHKSRTPGELIERIDGDVNMLSSFFSESIVHLLGNIILILGVLILLSREDWRLGLAMTTFAIPTLFILTLIHKYSIPCWIATRQKSADFFGFLGEQLMGTEDIRANGATHYVMDRFFLLLRNWLPVHRKAILSNYSMVMTSLIAFGFGNALALALGAYLWSIHAITLGTVYLIFYYTNLLNQPMDQIRVQLQELQQARAGIERVQQLFLTQTTIANGIGNFLPSGALSVEFNSVSFGYDSNDTALHNVNFYLKPGRVLGVLGRTGSGKTTLARLLLRLYDIQEGEISLCNVPIRTVSLQNLRQHIGIVTQDVQLFQATVRDNLTFFNKSVSDKRILEVLDDLTLSAWYSSLPMGLDTKLETDGVGLSTGQAQLLAFARVFLTNPGLVILDEASSHLDSLTEQLIKQAESKLFNGRTGIIIAHHLSAVQNVDEIMIMENGCIQEYGERNVLAENQHSHFYHLLETDLKEV